MEMAGGANVMQRRRAIALVGCLVLVWGCNWPINKIILTYVSPLWFTCLRLGMGAICLFLIQVFHAEGIKPPARADLPVVLSIGLMQMAGVMAMMNLGLARVPAGRSAILSYTMPLWAIPGATLILGERLGLGKTTALLLGLGGIAFMFNPAGFDWNNRNAAIGNGCLLLAAGLWAAAIIHIRAHRWIGTSLSLAPWQMLIGLVPLITLAWLMEGPPQHVNFSLNAVVLALYSGPLITAFPFWAFVTVARILPAMTTSLTLLLVPVIGLLSSVVLLSEPINTTSVVGLFMIVSAIAAVGFIDSRAARLG